MSDSGKTLTNDLPENFWDLAEVPIDGIESLKEIHKVVIARLLDEAPDADTLELMLMERVAFLYIYIRAKENKQLFAHDRAYKETLQLWVGLAADLRKQRLRSVEEDKIRMEVIKEVAVALKEALKGIDPAKSAEVQDRFLSLVA